MLGCPSFRHAERRPRRVGVRPVCRTRSCLGALVALAASGCFPEQTLSSYMNGSTSSSGIVTSSGSSRADAGPPVVDAGPPEAPASNIPDAGGTAGRDAAPPGLVCREECVCEAQGELSFMFCAAPVSHALALERCELAGGNLVSVDDEDRNTWLSERMQALDADDFWLSGTDTGTEGVWSWSDGRVFFGGDAGSGPFVPWDEGQPNDVNGEDCMRATAGVWRDLDCEEEIAYVCQG